MTKPKTKGRNKDGTVKKKQPRRPPIKDPRMELTWPIIDELPARAPIAPEDDRSTK
jgi:hypothetical protein